MALPALLGAGARAVGGQMVKSGGRAAASKILKRGDKKQTGIVKRGDGQQATGGGGALTIRPKTTMIPAKVMTSKSSPQVSEGSGSNILEEIYKKIIAIDKTLKGTLAEEKARSKTEKKDLEKQGRQKQEEKLEKKKPKEGKKERGLQIPNISFFDRVKKFITSIITGFILQKLVEFGPEKFMGVLTAIGTGLEVVTDLIIGVVDAAGTFLKWGQDAYDATKGWLGDKFGDGAEKTFEGFMSNLNTAFNLIGIIALGVAATDPFDMFGDKNKNKNKKSPKPGQGIDAKSGKPRKPKANEIIDPDGKIRAKTQPETKLKSMGLDDDQIQAFNKARAGGANTPQAMAQARKVKPTKPKPQGFFGRLGQSLSDLGSDAKDLATKGVKALGGGLNYLSGGNLGKLGNFLQDQYKNASKFAQKQYDRVTATAKRLKGKFDAGMKAAQSKLASLAEGAKKLVIQKILDPLKPFLDPIIKKVKSIGDKLINKLQKIPGFDNITKVLKKFGGEGSQGLLKKLGAKAIPIIGGLFNLLFAYDRLATGDSTGALIETVSAGFDLAGLSPASMALDAYMFARDFVPAIQEKETEVVKGLGLGGLKSMLDTAGAKLPDLEAITKIITGGDSPDTSTKGADAPPAVTGTDEGGIGEGSGANVSGATGKGMQTGPAGYDRIGVGAAYHVDTKFHQSIGIGGMVSAMDKMADAYAARDREIVFSGQGPARLQAYTSDLDPDRKKFLLNEAIKAHSHSTFMRAEGFKPFDYYIPSTGIRDLYHPSTEGAEILLPEMGGKIDVGALYGGYGKSANIYDSSGKWVAMTGHGDLAYYLGGFTKAMAHGAILGEKGREFVMDADSTAAIERQFPGLLSDINAAKGSKAIDALRNYASYEGGDSQTIIINRNQIMGDMAQQRQKPQAPIVIPVGGSDPTAGLYAMS